MSALIAGSELINVIGVVLDSGNPNLQSKWQSFVKRLRKEGYEVPDLPSKNGTIIQMLGKPKVGIW